MEQSVQPIFYKCGKIISTSGHSLCHLSDVIVRVRNNRIVVVLKSDARAGFGRLRSITFITASVTATVGWLWLLVDVAEWLIGV